jgi:putative DNA primase/helicase
VTNYRICVRKRPSLVARVQRIIDDFVKKMRADTEPWERRFAEKFGIVLAGAILMSEFGIGPWTKQRARKAIATLYRKARSAIVSIKDATDALLKRLRGLVKAGKRFPLIKKGENYNEADTWGLTRKMSDGNRAVLVPLSRFDRLVRPSAAAKAALAELEKRAILIKGADGKPTRQMKIEGSKKRHRYVCLNRKALLAE